MAVGVVVQEAVAEPEDAVEAEIARQPRLDLVPTHAFVAVRVQEALLGGDGEAGTVDIDRAAFQDPIVVVGFRSEAHKSELQSLMRIPYALFCLKTKK